MSISSNTLIEEAQTALRQQSTRRRQKTQALTLFTQFRFEDGKTNLHLIIIFAESGLLSKSVRSSIYEEDLGNRTSDFCQWSSHDHWTSIESTYSVIREKLNAAGVEVGVADIRGRKWTLPWVTSFNQVQKRILLLVDSFSLLIRNFLVPRIFALIWGERNHSSF